MSAAPDLHHNSTWPPEVDKRLRQLWDAGKTGAEIASLVFDGSRSRSAILGRIHRLGLPKRTDAPEAKARREARQAAKAVVRLPAFRASGADLAYVPNDRQGCQFICADPSVDATKCGLPRRMRLGKETAYCAEHYDRCYVPYSTDKEIRRARDRARRAAT